MWDSEPGASFHCAYFQSEKLTYLPQCAIPAFEGLLPSPHNKKVMALLYTLAEWHGFAKLRQHTDHTLDTLDALTTRLGDQLRAFVKTTCSAIDTKELSREYQARKRRESRQKQGNKTSAKRQKTSDSSECPTGSGTPHLLDERECPKADKASSTTRLRFPPK